MTEMDPAEAAARFEAGELCLLDVRTPEECALVAVEGAVCIPLDQLPAQHEQLPRDRPLAVLCHHGIRSAHAAHWLERQGHSPVFNVSGGIDRWAVEVHPPLPRY
jgi:rhodanese-related sulfurtransferase